MDILLSYAIAQVGIPYHYGGKNPLTGFDCSGLVSWILKSCKVIPWASDFNAQELYNFLEPSSSPDRWALGSIAFYGESVTKIVHVAFCVDQFRMVEAGGGDHMTLTVADAAAKSACVKMNSIRYRKDFLCVIKPNYSPIGVV